MAGADQYGRIREGVYSVAPDPWTSRANNDGRPASLQASLVVFQPTGSTRAGDREVPNERSQH